MSRPGTTFLPATRPSLAYEMQEIMAYIDNCTSHIPKLLEVGCGTQSVVSRRLRESKRSIAVHGLDIEAYALENKDVDEVYIANAEHMPFDDGAYDIVVSQYMLEHVHDYRKTLKEMARVVTKDGILVLRFPNPTSPEAIVTRLTPFWFHVFFRKCIQKVIEAERKTFPTTFSFKSVENVVKELKLHNFIEVNIAYFAETHYRFQRQPLLVQFVMHYANLLSMVSLDRLKSSVVAIARK